jgi:hypothetical protein
MMRRRSPHCGGTGRQNPAHKRSLLDTAWGHWGRIVSVASGHAHCRICSRQLMAHDEHARLSAFDTGRDYCCHAPCTRPRKMLAPASVHLMVRHLVVMPPVETKQECPSNTKGLSLPAQGIRRKTDSLQCGWPSRFDQSYQLTERPRGPRAETKLVPVRAHLVASYTDQSLGGSGSCCRSYSSRRVRARTARLEEAEKMLARVMEDARQAQVYGVRHARTHRCAALGHPRRQDGPRDAHATQKNKSGRLGCKFVHFRPRRPSVRLERSLAMFAPRSHLVPPLLND